MTQKSKKDSQNKIQFSFVTHYFPKSSVFPVLEFFTMLCLASADLNLVLKFHCFVLLTNIYFFAKDLSDFFGGICAVLRVWIHTSQTSLYFLSSQRSIFLEKILVNSKFDFFESSFIKRSKKSRYKMSYKFHIFGFSVVSATFKGSISQKIPPGNWFSGEIFYNIIVSPQKKFMWLSWSCKHFFWCLLKSHFWEDNWKISTIMHRAVVSVYYHFYYPLSPSYLWIRLWKKFLQPLIAQKLSRTTYWVPQVSEKLKIQMVCKVNNAAIVHFREVSTFGHSVRCIKKWKKVCYETSYSTK